MFTYIQGKLVHAMFIHANKNLHGLIMTFGFLQLACLTRRNDIFLLKL
jgi:hypothetical protein